MSIPTNTKHYWNIIKLQYVKKPKEQHLSAPQNTITSRKNTQSQSLLKEYLI